MVLMHIPRAIGKLRLPLPPLFSTFRGVGGHHAPSSSRRIYAGEIVNRTGIIGVVRDKSSIRLRIGRTER